MAGQFRGSSGDGNSGARAGAGTRMTTMAAGGSPPRVRIAPVAGVVRRKMNSDHQQEKNCAMAHSGDK